MAYKWAEGQAKQLAQRLRYLQRRLEQLVTETSSTRDTSNSYWLARQRELRKVYEEMRTLTRGFMVTKVSRAYDNAIRGTIADLKGSEFTPKTVHYNEFSRSQVYSQGLGAIVSDGVTSFANAYLSGQTEFLRMMRYTQQVNLTEKQINRALEEGYLEGGSPQSAARSIRDGLLEKLKDGKFLSLVDKNGDTRRYQVDKYAEMVARTKLIQATTNGVTQATLAAGGDLVQVSVHNTVCPICAEFEGKIYSLSGADADFPAASELPPYHPNCQHTIDPVFREFLEVQGTLDDFINFSNDDTGQVPHPTRDSWVPVSARNMEGR